VGIDMIAGPSEILVIADADNDPDWIALDMMSQAEHDESAQSILITPDADLARAVADAVDKRLETLERRAIAGASWRDFGAIVTVRDLDEAAELSDRIAPEHLELCVPDPDALAARIRHAGAIFLGQWTPEAIGDYAGGPNHVLPTARSARFSSGLSVMDFLKRTTLARMTPDALRAIGPVAEVLARSESLEAHGLSVTASSRSRTVMIAPKSRQLAPAMARRSSVSSRASTASATRAPNAASVVIRIDWADSSCSA
jgi:histidinol dehydrogenase